MTFSEKVFFSLILGSYKTIICFISVLSLFTFRFWYNNQLSNLNRSEIEENWIDCLTSGYLSVNHMNRLIVYASENNLKLNSSDIDILEIDNIKRLHNVLSEQSNQMLNFANILNEINKTIMEFITTWLSSLEKNQFESNRNLVSNSTTNIKELLKKVFNFKISLQI